MDRVLNFKKGDKCIVAIERGSNESRNKNISLENINEWIYEGEVISSGKKYVTVSFKRSNKMKFSIADDYREEYKCGGADFKLYKDKQEVINTFKREDLLGDLFGGLGFNRPPKINKLTLEQLEKINDIINE